MGELFGRGLSFPPRLDADGRFAWSADEANVRESIALILKTEPGERVGLPAFGAGLGDFLFEPNQAATHARMAERVADALARWEGRIAVEAVDVAPDAADPETALVTITYRLVATGARERIGVGVALGAA